MRVLSTWNALSPNRDVLSVTQYKNTGRDTHIFFFSHAKLNKLVKLMSPVSFSFFQFGHQENVKLFMCNSRYFFISVYKYRVSWPTLRTKPFTERGQMPRQGSEHGGAWCDMTHGTPLGTVRTTACTEQRRNRSDRDDGGSDQDAGSRSNWSCSRYILQVESPWLADGLDGYQ